MNGYNALESGTLIQERYRIQKKIGDGHSSSVYNALDLKTESEVALKVLDPFLAQNPVNVERFAREVRIIRSVNHPNVVKIYDFFRWKEYYVICMEFMPGKNAKTLVQETGPLRELEFLKVAKAVVSTLAECHRRGILHRDIKPQNLMIDAQMNAKLLDFGISKMNSMSDLTKTGTVIGTPEYMAPEAFGSSKASDPRSDIYSMGTVLYELLAGRPPFKANSLSAIMKLHIKGEIEKISVFQKGVSAWLEAIIYKCLATDPAKRYQSAFELLDDLKQGEKSLAIFDEKRPVSKCLSCKTEFLPGLNFCHSCGKFSEEVYEPGKHSIAIYRLEEHRPFAEFLSRNYPQVKVPTVLRRFRKYPVLLVRDVSERTALGIANELSLYPCEYEVTHNLPVNLRLPKRYFWYGMLVMSPLFVPGWGAAMSGLLRFLILLAANVVIFGLYLTRIQPLLKFNFKEEKKKTVTDGLLVEFANSLKGLKDKNLKTIVGHVICKYVRIRSRLGDGHIPELEPAVTAIKKSIESAIQIEQNEGYLRSTSLNQIKERIDTVELRLKRTKDPLVLEQLVDIGAKLKVELENYQKIQDTNSELFTSIVNLNASLKQLEMTLVGSKEVADSPSKSLPLPQTPAREAA